MKSLVKMKDEGNFDEVMEKILPKIDDIKERINAELGARLEEDRPFFDSLI